MSHSVRGAHIRPMHCTSPSMPPRCGSRAIAPQVKSSEKTSGEFHEDHDSEKKKPGTRNVALPVAPRPGVLAAQAIPGPVTVSHARPLYDEAARLQLLFGKVVTYEDPVWRWTGDSEPRAGLPTQVPLLPETRRRGKRSRDDLGQHPGCISSADRRPAVQGHRIALGPSYRAFLRFAMRVGGLWTQ